MLLLGIEFSTECHPVKIECNMPYGRIVRGFNAKQSQDCLFTPVSSVATRKAVEAVSSNLFWSLSLR